MSRRSQEKRRARAREKKLEARRTRGLSPLARLLPDDERHNFECWLHYFDDTDRPREIAVVRAVRDGQFILAIFDIDYECIGLRSATYHTGISLARVHEMFREQSRDQGARTVRTDPARARALIAAAIRWTQSHPFRLPDQTPDCLSILGGVLDPDQADLSAFGTPDGKLLFAGDLDELEDRLVGMTFDDYLAAGHHYITEAEPDDLPDPDDEDARMADNFADIARHMADSLLEAHDVWCDQTGNEPHPGLDRRLEAWVIARLGRALARLAGKELPQSLDAMIISMLAEMPLEDRAAVAGAAPQLEQFLTWLRQRHLLPPILDDESPAAPTTGAAAPLEISAAGISPADSAAEPPSTLPFPQPQEQPT